MYPYHQIVVLGWFHYGIYFFETNISAFIYRTIRQYEFQLFMLQKEFDWGYTVYYSLERLHCIWNISYNVLLLFVAALGPTAVILALHSIIIHNQNTS